MLRRTGLRLRLLSLLLWWLWGVWLRLVCELLVIVRLLAWNRGACLRSHVVIGLRRLRVMILLLLLSGLIAGQQRWAWVGLGRRKEKHGDGE